MSSNAFLSSCSFSVSSFETLCFCPQLLRQCTLQRTLSLSRESSCLCMVVLSRRLTIAMSAWARDRHAIRTYVTLWIIDCVNIIRSHVDHSRECLWRVYWRAMLSFLLFLLLLVDFYCCNHYGIYETQTNWNRLYSTVNLLDCVCVRCCARLHAFGKIRQLQN